MSLPLTTACLSSGLAGLVAGGPAAVGAGLLAWLARRASGRVASPCGSSGPATAPRSCLICSIKLFEVLDDLGLLLPGLLAGVGLAEPLLDLAHLLDDLASGCSALLAVLVLLLPLSCR